ncbi:CaiB/BaiF CoA transferase family protein [Meridianimarinicoccus aquatilis]|uniref:CoA transferase n=1 Tax=Meridianimarinicoccus aquatilis TaxID=2552766 RepID=A0A4R6ALB8_9RHOB|nr:CoA transferase [Fluviibacterium aquatile]TDL84427.1 CoA transferase [Fluviibacterium aquatile]
MMDASDTKGALSGLVVLDLSRILAGPTCTQLLADLGATVWKIENPKTGGDDTRAWGPPYAPDGDGNDSDLSAYFMSSNRGKRSVAADLANPADRALLERLAARADVVIENFKPGGLEQYGLDHATLCARHPGLVYCSISGFGQTGPNRNKPGYDLMAQGYGGIMSLTGAPDGPPMKVGVGIADVMCGMYATIGILAALRHRDATGEGQHIDLALVDAQMAWLINEGVNFLTSGTPPQRRGNGHPNIVPYDVFAASDGHVIIAVGNDSQFVRFCDFIGRADLPEDPRFATNPARLIHREALLPQVATALGRFSMADIIAGLEARKVPVGPVNTIPQALDSDQAHARDATVELARDNAPPVRVLGNPLKLSRTPVRHDLPPPSFGEGTNALKEWLGERENADTAHTDEHKRVD